MTEHLTPLERANDLLGRMTLTEKTRQVSAIMPAAMLASGGLAPEVLQQHLGLGIGHLSNPAMAASSPEHLAGIVNAIQHFLVENTRLGIPAMAHAEALNGLVAPGFTSFPTAIGLAAAWDPDAVEEMATIIRGQMRAVGVRHALSPVLDIARDARWGRVHETYGEDVQLVSAMGVAFVRGLQGDDLREGVIATGKHFLGYSMTEAGQNMATTALGNRELYDVYATPFEAAIHLAGLHSVMNSYSEVDGVPVGASRTLLTDMLRGRMGFDGSVVSDYSTVEWLHTRQRIGDSIADAGVRAIEAGLDIELPVVSGYGANLEDAVRSGRLPEDVLDEAVRRALVDKFATGLFENPYAERDTAVLTRVAREGSELSRRLADESITLLKNDGVLPLAPGIRVAVIGPNATSAMANFAAYTQPAQLDMMKGMATGESRMAGVSTMTDADPEAAAQIAASRAALATIDSEQVARHAYGALSLAEAVGELGEVTAVTGVGIHPDDPQDIAAAVAAAQNADVVVLAIGGRAGWFGTRITEGEGTDMARIELPEPQVRLVRAVAETGTPLVGVMYQGRPYALAEIDGLLSALVVAYYPGPHGARAVADALFGVTNPAGRLPYSMPRATGQVPLYYSQHHGSGYRRGEADMFRSYIDLDPSPLYPFGRGLSYTTFSYGALTLEHQDLPTDGGRMVASLEVRNTGARDGSEVVQLYVSDTASGVTRPALQLAAFRRVNLAAGAVARVQFAVELSQLGYTDVDGRFVIEAGPMDVAAGPDSSDLRSHATLTVTGATVDLAGRRSYLGSSRVDPL